MTTEIAPVTPTGVHLGLLTPGTPEWDAARSGLTVTATEIAAVVGLSPWMSRFTLWHKKAGLPTPAFEASPAMRWGGRFEDDVAEEFGEQHPEFIFVDAGTWRHRGRPWQRATPDRLLAPVCGCGLHRPDCCDPEDCGPCCPDCPTCPTQGVRAAELLEIKTSLFGDDWADGLPVHYRCQVMWQLDTLGLSRARVALLILSGLEYREYEIEYDAEEAAFLRGEARAFLDSVAAGQRPPIDSAADTYQTVRAQHEGRDDIEVQIPAALAERYEAAGAAQKAAEEERRQAAAEVLDAIGTGRWATDPTGRRIAQRTTANSLTPCKPPKKGDSL